MPDFIYCGTVQAVHADGTQALLLGPYEAIWYPPPRLAVEPSAGDRLWLVWRSSPDNVPLLLGGGRIRVTNEGQVLWTEATLPGVRGEAIGLGYGGPSNMAFLRLTGIKAPQGRLPVDLGQISSGLNVAASAQVQLLTQALPLSQG